MHISAGAFCKVSGETLTLKLSLRLPFEVVLHFDDSGFHITRCDESGDIEELRDLNLNIFRNNKFASNDHPSDKFQTHFDEDFVRFVSSYNKHQSSVLRLTFGRPSVYQFAKDNPLLFWLFTHLYVRELIDERQVSTLVALRRTEALRLLMGLDGKRYLKFIEKLDLRRWDTEELQLVIKSLQNHQVVSTFKHWKIVPFVALKALERYPFLHDSKILRIFHDAPNGPVYRHFPSDFESIYFDTVELGSRLGLKNSRALVNGCETLDALRSLHDSWSEALNRRLSYLADDQPLPEAPIAGRKWVVQIRTINELLREAKEMQNCLATYVDKLRNGTSFIFSVTAPERATVEIIERDGQLTINEISLYKNRKPSDQTWDRVINWVEEEKRKVDDRPPGA